jgi:hypothetical protein
MRTPLLLTLGALALAPARAGAQVSGTIVIDGGPVGGVITIGDRRPARRVVVVERYAPRVIVVERLDRRYDRKHPVVRHRDRHDRVIIFYDRRDRAFYDRPYRRGLVEVEVIRYRGRYYIVEDRRGRHW